MKNVRTKSRKIDPPPLVLADTSYIKKNEVSYTKKCGCLPLNGNPSSEKCPHWTPHPTPEHNQEAKSVWKGK